MADPRGGHGGAQGRPWRSSGADLAQAPGGAPTAARRIPMESGGAPTARAGHGGRTFPCSHGGHGEDGFAFPSLLRPRRRQIPLPAGMAAPSSTGAGMRLPAGAMAGREGEQGRGGRPWRLQGTRGPWRISAAPPWRRASPARLLRPPPLSLLSLSWRGRTNGAGLRHAGAFPFGRYAARNTDGSGLHVDGGEFGVSRCGRVNDRQQNGVSSHPKVESLKQSKEDESPQSRGSQEGCSSSSSPSAVGKEISPTPASPRPQQQAQPALLPSSSASTNHEDELCRTTHSGSSGNQSPEPAGRNAPLSEASSPGPSEYRLCKPVGAQDAATQTDDSERDVHENHTRVAGMSMDTTSDAEIQECNQRSSPKGPEIVPESPAVFSSDASPGARVETLESLIRAEASRRSSFRTLEGEHMLGPMGVKLKPGNLLMQLITCGSISVKEHRGFGFIPSYRPRFTQVEFPSPAFSTPVALRHLDKIPCNTRTIGMRAPESECFSGSLVEANKQDESGRGISSLKRSSSYDEDRVYRVAHSKSDTESSGESRSFRCLPQTIRIISCKQSRNGTIPSPASDVRNSSSRQEYSTRSSPLGSSKSASNRMTDPSLGKLSSARVESFHEEKDVIKIEERLPSGARVIIQSVPLCEESDESNESL